MNDVYAWITFGFILGFMVGGAFINYVIVCKKDEEK